MSNLRKIMESPPKNTGKRPAEPEPEQWYTSGFQRKEVYEASGRVSNQPPAKKKRIVPEQLNFTESDSVASMRAQILGLRCTVRRLQEKLEEEKGNVAIALCNHSALQKQYERQEKRHQEDRSSQKQCELQLLANCRAYEREKVAMQDDFDLQWKRKESEVRRLQREFNDAVNALLASEVE